MILLYLLGINLAAFLLFGADKKRACRREWRISENTLLAVAAAGGSAGALAGMFWFRHKTRHRKFTLGLPLILAAQFLLLIGWNGAA